MTTAQTQAELKPQLRIFCSQCKRLGPNEIDFSQDFSHKVVSKSYLFKYGTLLNCEGKTKMENPKADQNTLFCKYLIFEKPRDYF